MAIAFSCPSCEHRLKVKDELAGRKVKCPGCGGGVLVPAVENEEEVAAPARPARPSRQTREAPDEEEDRPRKKKKKKKKDNKLLVIGLAAGGVLLVALIVLLILLNRPQSEQPIVKGPQSKVQPEPEPKPAVKDPEPKPVPPPLEKRVVTFWGAGERESIKNDLRQIGLFYAQYRDTFKKGPATSKAFADYIRRDTAALAAQFDKGAYAVIPAARPNSSTVVAYDAAGDVTGNHIVVFGDGRVDIIDQAELDRHRKQGK